MQSPEKVKDPVISQKVNDKLSSAGIRPPCHVTVMTSKGNVTLSGIIQYEHQRHMAIRAIQGLAGVQHVVDHMQVIPRAPQGKTNPTRGAM